MIRFGVVGTNWITDEFIRCARLVPEFHLRAVYSRTQERAREYAARQGAEHYFTSLKEMAASSQIDAVYIASPNSLHASQALVFLNHHKHVLCEKPLAANSRELEEMLAAAEAKGVLLMEAMKTTLLPNYQALKQHLPRLGPVRTAFFTFCQYSARYDLYQQGELPNVFNPMFASGSLMDIGIYCLYPALDLFGPPVDLSARGFLLPSGVDGCGTVTMSYPEMVVTLQHSKITHSPSPSEIQGELGTIIIDKISKPARVEVLFLDGAREVISIDQSEDAMYHEAREFIELIKAGKAQSSVNTFSLARSVMQALDEARSQLGVSFPADKI